MFDASKEYSEVKDKVHNMFLHIIYVLFMYQGFANKSWGI